MKPLLFTIGLLLGSFGLSAFAQKATHEPKRIQLQEIITSVSVNDDIDIVLTDSQANELLVDGNPKAVSVFVNDGHLQLAKTQQTAGVVKIYVPAAYVSKVFMNGTGELSSSAVLSGSRLKIVLAGESKIALRSTGNVTVEAVDDIQFVKSR